MDHLELNKKIMNCENCPLFHTRTQAVPGKGSSSAKIMFIGEAPGANEDKNGVPFCGKSGAVLDILLSSINLSREDIFITNIVKCRPPNNRDPNKEEIALCLPYLEEQIALIKPKVIASLGRFAMSFLMEKYSLPKETITGAHGKKFKLSTAHGEIAVVPLYHPAVAVYNPNNIQMLKEDFKQLKE